MGIKEQLIFPEIDYDKIDKVRGMDIGFVTTANNDEDCLLYTARSFQSVPRQEDGRPSGKRESHRSESAGCQGGRREQPYRYQGRDSGS